MTQGRPPRWRTTTRLLVWAAILSASAVTMSLTALGAVASAGAIGNNQRPASARQATNMSGERIRFSILLDQNMRPVATRDEP